MSIPRQRRADSAPRCDVPRRHRPVDHRAALVERQGDDMRIFKMSNCLVMIRQLRNERALGSSCCLHYVVLTIATHGPCWGLHTERHTGGGGRIGGLKDWRIGGGLVEEEEVVGDP